MFFMRVNMSVACTNVYRLVNVIYMERPALLLVRTQRF